MKGYEAMIETSLKAICPICGRPIKPAMLNEPYEHCKTLALFQLNASTDSYLKELQAEELDAIQARLANPIKEVERL
jgi:hypothetical protein